MWIEYINICEWLSSCVLCMQERTREYHRIYDYSVVCCCWRWHLWIEQFPIHPIHKHTHTHSTFLLNILEHWNVRWVIAVHCYVVVSCLYMRRRDIYLCTQQTHFSHNSIWLIWLYLLYFKYNCLWLSLITRFCAIQIDNRKHLASHGVAMWCSVTTQTWLTWPNWHFRCVSGSQDNRNGMDNTCLVLGHTEPCICALWPMITSTARRETWQQLPASNRQRKSCTQHACIDNVSGSNGQFDKVHTENGTHTHSAQSIYTHNHLGMMKMMVTSTMAHCLLAVIGPSRPLRDIQIAHIRPSGGIYIKQ